MSDTEIAKHVRRWELTFCLAGFFAIGILIGIAI